MGQAVANALSSVGAVFTTPFVKQVDLKSIIVITAVVLLVAVPAVLFLQLHMRRAIAEID